MANDNQFKSAFRAKVKIGGVNISFDDMIDLTVSSQLNLPDAFSLKLGSTGTVKHDVLPNIKLTDRIEAQLNYVGDSPDFAFVGELTRVEPITSRHGVQGGFTVLVGYNAMHGLTRGKRSTTYLNQTDKDIVEQILQNNSACKLTAEFCKDPPKIKHEHVYQHNKSPLQFLLDRAKRTGHFVLVRDGKLLYKKRDPTPSGYKLKAAVARKEGDDDGKTISLDHFVPVLSTARQVTEVIVRTWNPRTRKELIGKAPKSGAGQGGAQLGSQDGKSAIEERYPDSVLVHTNTVFHSQDEGDALAAAILDECMLSYVQAQGCVPGDPRLKPGMVVEIVTGNKQNDGKYFLTAVQHRYLAGDDLPYKTFFSARRDAIEEPDPDASTLGT
jgi:phage protein D